MRHWLLATTMTTAVVDAGKEPKRRALWDALHRGVGAPGVPAIAFPF